MHPLDIGSIVSLGTALGALVTVLCVLLAPALGAGGAIRLVAVANTAFTLMMAVRASDAFEASQTARAAIGSLLVASAILSAAAVRALGDPPPGGRASRSTIVAIVVGVFAPWVAAGQSGSPAAAAFATAVATLACCAVGLSAALALSGPLVALPRRVLAASFGAGLPFAAYRMHVSLDALLHGAPPPAFGAGAYFGATLLFCAINLGFLLLLHVRATERVTRLAQVDELTGALNRRGLAERLAALRADPRVPPVGALVLIDIDRFKSINDVHGHPVGDEVLRWFARTLRGFMRADDLLVRMGGEEFCLVLPGVDAMRAAHVAERIRSAFDEDCIAPTSAGPLRVTASFGVAAFGAGDDRPDASMRRADTALYAAKRGGRNRVARWEPAMGEGAGD
jgi:diguanylate cyclase (GGDEF)-like protein